MRIGAEKTVRTKVAREAMPLETPRHAADAGTGFQDGGVNALPLQKPCSSQTSGTTTQDDDVRMQTVYPSATAGRFEFPDSDSVTCGAQSRRTLIQFTLIDQLDPSPRTTAVVPIDF